MKQIILSITVVLSLCSFCISEEIPTVCKTIESAMDIAKKTKQPTLFGELLVEQFRDIYITDLGFGDITPLLSYVIINGENISLQAKGTHHLFIEKKENISSFFPKEAVYLDMTLTITQKEGGSQESYYNQPLSRFLLSGTDLFVITDTHKKL